MRSISGMSIGKQVGRQLLEQVQSMAIQMELMYSFIIIVCSLMVYFGTKELYKLSGHKGIKYFRQSFLFFAIAYFFRSTIVFAVKYLQVSRIIEFSPRIFALGPVTLVIFMYTSTMAIFCLTYSVMYKKFKNPNTIYLFHALAIALSIITSSIKEVQILLTIQVILFLFVITTAYLAHKSTKKKKNSLYVIYVLLFAFWILNIIDILVPNLLQSFKLLISLSSILIFLTILYKVLKNSGSN